MNLTPSPTGVFSLEALQREVALELAKCPPEHRYVAYGYYDFRGRWKVTIGVRVGSHVEFGVTAQKDFAQGIQGGLTFRGSW